MSPLDFDQVLWLRGWQGSTVPTTFSTSKVARQRVSFRWGSLVPDGYDGDGSSSQETYPLVNIQKAMENDPVEIVDFPIK